jgi:hypothetical protein
LSAVIVPAGGHSSAAADSHPMQKKVKRCDWGSASPPRRAHYDFPTVILMVSETDEKGVLSCPTIR